MRSYNVDTTSRTGQRQPCLLLVVRIKIAVVEAALPSPLTDATVHIHITSSIRVNDFDVDEIILTGGCVGTLNPLVTQLEALGD